MDKEKLRSLKQNADPWGFALALIPLIEQIIDEINRLKAAQDDSTAAVIDSPTTFERVTRVTTTTGLEIPGGTTEI